MLLLGARAAIAGLVAAGMTRTPPVLAAAPTPTTTPGTGATVPINLAADASPAFRAVAEAVTRAMANAQIPGVAIGILADGREEVAGFGITSIETGEPVTPDTLFQLG